MEFKKYPSLKNHYKKEDIDFWIKNNPNLVNEVYEISEKIHGSNFQINITRNEIKFGRRNGFLKDGESFFDYQSVMEKYMDKFKNIQDYLSGKELESITIYGELYGEGIQKVNYIKDKDFKLFDIVVDGEIIPIKQRDALCVELEIENMIVPRLGIAKSLFDALGFDIRLNSKLSKEKQLIEGVVIKPYKNIYEYNGDVFYIKKKNESFLERKIKKKIKRSSGDLKLKNEFCNYITDNRLDSVISKEGKLENPKQIGKFIKLLSEDAKDDFCSEVDLSKASDFNFIYSEGNHLCAKLIKNRLGMI